MHRTFAERRPILELLDEFPEQGDWDVDDYLSLTTKRLVELTNGVLEFLPMPTETHQELAEWLLESVKAILRHRGDGIAKGAPFKIRVGRKKFREPDVCVLLDRADSRRGDKYWLGADLVIEVVSRGDADRDYVRKRRVYARAMIPEYWIVDPQRRIVRQLALEGARYRVVGTFRAGELPTSTVLDGWTLDVAACMAIVDAAPPDVPPAERDAE